MPCSCGFSAQAVGNWGSWPAREPPGGTRAPSGIDFEDFLQDRRDFMCPAVAQCRLTNRTTQFFIVSRARSLRASLARRDCLHSGQGHTRQNSRSAPAHRQRRETDALVSLADRWIGSLLDGPRDRSCSSWLATTGATAERERWHGRRRAIACGPTAANGSAIPAAATAGSPGATATANATAASGPAAVAATSAASAAAAATPTPAASTATNAG